MLGRCPPSAARRQDPFGVGVQFTPQRFGAHDVRFIGEARTRIREDYVLRHPKFTEHAAFVLCGTDDGATILGSAS